MISPFIINDKNLFLDRFPINQVNRSLQAWDAADEYLLNYAEDSQLINPHSKILIFNDNFGALTLNFPENKIYSISDSFVSQLGLKHNAEQNHLGDENITLLSSMDCLPDDINIVLYKIPKSKNLLVEQLNSIKNHSVMMSFLSQPIKQKVFNLRL